MTKSKLNLVMESHRIVIEFRRYMEEALELSTEEMQDYINMDISLDELEKNMFESRE